MEKFRRGEVTMYRQRKVARESFRPRDKETFWAPEVEKHGERTRIEGLGKNDWYAVVDDIAEGTVLLRIAAWPTLDKGGRLRFDASFEQDYALEALQRIVNEERTRQGQPAADRPLRTGDAFSIHSEDRPGRGLTGSDFKGSLLDISGPARAQAKIALYSAVARSLSPDEETKLRKKPGRPDRFQRIAGERERAGRHRPGETAKPEV